MLCGLLAIYAVGVVAVYGFLIHRDPYMPDDDERYAMMCAILWPVSVPFLIVIELWLLS